MAKCKYLQDTAQREADALATVKYNFCIEMGGAVGKIEKRLKVKQYQIAKMAGFKQSTFSTKMQKPETFTMNEVFRLMQFPEIREGLMKSL